MSRSRYETTAFIGGVLDPTATARTDLEGYNQTMKVGKNITVSPLGGVKKRAGSLFIASYDADYVRLEAFVQNKVTKYLIVFTNLSIDIYLGGIKKATVATPYNNNHIRELNVAHSGDVMIIAHNAVALKSLQRLGSDTDWNLVDTPIINPPQQDCDSEGENCRDAWSPATGYPACCTFFQGRLWLGNTPSRPQTIWASVSQDFFNFDVMDGEKPNGSIQETLDTDYIFPITAIFGATKLQVFTTGAEFVQTAERAITPLTSGWEQQSNYGSISYIRPILIDGSTIYLDSTGKTVRTFIYSDDTKQYESISISTGSEHLVNSPIKLGVMRGVKNEPANFIFLVNTDGTVAVCSVSKGEGVVAWSMWETQGDYKDIIATDEDLYMLVTRNIGGVKKWVLEQGYHDIYVDCGAKNVVTKNTIVESLPHHLGDYFGVYGEAMDSGKIVIVLNGEVVFKTVRSKKDFMNPVYLADGTKFRPLKVWGDSDIERANHFKYEQGATWAMFGLERTVTTSTPQNIITGLSHLMGQYTHSLADGLVTKDLLVTAGASSTTKEIAYPFGEDWLYDADNRISIKGKPLYETEITLDAMSYSNLPSTPYGYLLEGVEGEAGSTYFQKGLWHHIDIEGQSFFYVRLITLVAVPTVVGSITLPFDYADEAQAGLPFPVVIQTADVNPNMQNGSLRNEPKRIVSAEVRFYETQGATIQGYPIIERVVGEVNILDASVPLQTGISKIRLLGYSKETNLTILQMEPLPLYLLGIITEINY